MSSNASRGWLAGALVLAALSGSGARAADRSFGIWRNPSDSVHIRVEPCGASMCGVVVWASDKARDDARRGGTDPLVGARLFRDFVREGDGVWRGRVFVPDIGKTFSGTVSVIDERRIVGRGCLLARIGCRSQEWTKVRD